MSSFLIRPFEEPDWPACWHILSAVFSAGTTYPYPPDTSEAEARGIWLEGKTEVHVAVDDKTGELLGTYYLKPNQPGLGSHVCNSGYVTAATARGRGVASEMCKHSQRRAISAGFRAMQFNFVVETNSGAIRLWKKLGFETIGRIPQAFAHPEHGLTDARIMYKRLG